MKKLFPMLVILLLIVFCVPLTAFSGVVKAANVPTDLERELDKCGLSDQYTSVICVTSQVIFIG